ncbi:hypothetical protein PoB_006224700 [Plakobranchus ocellatus]|uniref:Uncharacterized protein n=1 Tax=Plakobranchus ocellatus TaxID=259542 RepID=A0AAV4CV07_9GAST|nr:hypothetical protein PoB_006224700 [Plakobranchus ocellatus]
MPSDQKFGTPDTGIIIRSLNTDVFLLMIAYYEHFTQPLYFDTGVGNKSRRAHIQTFYNKMEKHIKESVLGLHAFTGCDVTSAFVEKEKIKPLNILHKHPGFAVSFNELGTSEKYFSRAAYQSGKVCSSPLWKTSILQHKQASYDLVRLKYMAKSRGLLSSFGGFDISLLPPCRSCESYEQTVKLSYGNRQLWLNQKSRIK